MNKNLHRIVFNKTRGVLMAVCESASSQAGGALAASEVRLDEPVVRFALRPGFLAVCLLTAGTFGFLPYANAQVVADPNAANNLRPQILNAANGVPLVNIQTPSAAGVSRNVYSQFDVQAQGVILNNARSNAQTQLGGWVQANPNLAGGAARIILNEVNSSNPSVLRGYMEVAGSRAQVVVANPAGITCDGCGFINTERATLTTGTPIMNGGSLDGYRVERGHILIQGNGLDASQTDYTDLIARSVEVNAGIWAKELRVTAGANQVNAANTQADRLNPSSPAPALAIDVAQLGGMYAGKIHLIGTEAGVGVKNAGSIGASAGEVRITVDGQVLNSGSITSTETTAINATTLTNRGLIDGAKTQLATNTLDNLGTGRIYGDDIGIAAGTLNNTVESGVAPTIAARNRLDLGVGNLNNDNGALIFSSGDIAIAGALDTNFQATGRAGTLTNNGGTIQALGDMSVIADKIENINANFDAVAELSATTVSRTSYYTSIGTITEDQIESKSDYGVWGPLLSGNGTPNPSAYSTISFVLKPTATNPNSVSTGAIAVYSFLVENYQPLVSRVISSAPGQFLSGGNMALDAATSLTNDKSRIVAGGNLDILGQSINNIAAQVSGTEYHSGTSYNWGYAGHDGKSTGHHCDCDFYAFKWSPYSASVPLTIDAQITTAAGNQTLSGGSNPSLPNSSLYSTNPSTVARYLVETDARFTNYRNWLSSDYMQQFLALDPSVAQKRLGDGFYEQQLIREQIAQLTGRRFLTGYASDEAQYQALMDSAVTQAKAFNLRLGVALSPAQIAQLTSDIVWLVEKEVKLPDGTTQKVLAPQVYLMPRTGDLNADGTLIAGQSVFINASGDVNNSGTVAGRNLLQISANNIANVGGMLSADQVSLTATQDIVNRGGRISAVDSLALSAGRDITIETTTATGSGQAGNGNFSQTRVDRIAGLYVTGSTSALSAVAGRNLTLTAAEVVNTGSGATQLAALGDVVIGTVTTRDVIDIGGNSRNHARVTASSEVGSRIRTQGDLSIIAGNDIAGRAVDIQSQGNVTLAAGNDVTLAAGRNEQSVDLASYATGKSGGGLKQRTVTRDLQIKAETSTSITGTVSGQNITIQSGRDIGLEGGAYIAQDKLALAAGRDLTIAAGESSAVDQQKLQVSSKENFGFGKQSLKTTRDETTVTPDVAQLAGREISLKSGGDMTLVAPEVKAETLTATAGGALTVAAATATHELKVTSEFKTNRLNFDEVTAPLQGSNGIQNSLGLFTGKSVVTGGRIKDKIKLSESGSERVAVVADIAVKDIALNSGNDTTLVAPHIQAERLAITAGSVDGEVVDANAKIQFLGVKESSSTSSSKNSHSRFHETVRDSGQSVETLLLPKIELPDSVTAAVDSPIPAKTELALAAPGGIVVGATTLAPTQREQKRATSGSGGGSSGGLTVVDLKSQAQTLAQQPGLAWLGDLAQRQDVDWQKIELATQSWDYKRAGLTQEGAIVVAIVVTALTIGWGSALTGTAEAATLGGTAEAGITATSATTLGGTTLSTTVTTATVDGMVTTATTYTAAGAALNAGFSTLASQAAVSLINNQGDIGRTLNDLGSDESIKQIVASMLTAGVGQYYSGTYNLESLISKTATGCVTGELSGDTCQQGAATAGLLASLQWAGHNMRQNQAKSSELFKGFCDSSGKCFSNLSGQSSGIDGDGLKLGGNRINIDDICALTKQVLCTDGKLNSTLPVNEYGQILLPPDAIMSNGLPLNVNNLMDALPKSPLGGQQGGLGQLTLLPGLTIQYKPGSFFDKLVESFAGPHDQLNSSHYYDPTTGNNTTTFGLWGSELWNIVDVPIAAPFGISTLCRQYPEICNAMIENTKK